MSFKNTAIGLGTALGVAAAGAGAIYVGIVLSNVEQKVMFNNDPDKFECQSKKALDFNKDYLTSKSIKCDDGRTITYAPKSFTHWVPSKLTVHSDGHSYSQFMTVIPGFMRFKTHLKEILSFM